MAAVPASDNANDGWIIRRACPPDWPRLVGLCGGNFFHTPMGLLAGAPDGPPLYCEWWREGRVVGIASGVQSRCRLSLRPRHVYLPTMPALVPQADADEALTAVVRVLAARGAADVIVDSFAAPLAAPLAAPQPIVIRRSEYIVSFEDGRSELLGRFTNHHRRIVHRGTRAGWTLRLLRGPDASSILATVHDSAVRRHARRGSRYQARMPAAAPLATTDLTAFWGAAVFSAWDGEVLLTAALVGWANRRAYYISGGSSETGYRHSAAWSPGLEKPLIRSATSKSRWRASPSTCSTPRSPARTPASIRITASIGKPWGSLSKKTSARARSRAADRQSLSN